MKYMLEMSGRLSLRGGEAERSNLEQVFDDLATALADLSSDPADVAVNFETSRVELLLVIDAVDANEAASRGASLAAAAFDRAGLLAEATFDELHARRAEPALSA